MYSSGVLVYPCIGHVLHVGLLAVFTEFHVSSLFLMLEKLATVFFRICYVMGVCYVPRVCRVMDVYCVVRICYILGVCYIVYRVLCFCYVPHVCESLYACVLFSLCL